jgi:imidazolonepropionase-like amidohydrolase
VIRSSRLLAAIFGLGSGIASALPSQTLFIKNATVIDARSAVPRRGENVVVRGGKIVEAGPRVTQPSGAQVVDAAGLYLIPGLWDMHVHLDVPAGRVLLEAYVVNGVTGVRDMAGDWARLTGWRGEIRSGKTIGPRIIASGPYLEGNPQPIPHIEVKSPAAAEKAVDSLKKLGVDLVKIHTGLSRESYFAAARRARQLKMPFAGHVPRVVGAIDAADSGQRSVEHLLTVPTPCTPAESIALLPRFPVQRVFGPCTSQSLAPIYSAFVRNHTWVTPTYVAAVEIATWPKRALPGDAFAQFLPDTLKKFVLELFPMPDSIPADADIVGKRMYDKRLMLAGAMVRAGVHLLAGTDAPLRNSPPGFGLAEELVQIAKGGVPLFDVLKIATWEPASYLAATDSMGTVQAGRVADLVLLRENPLTDVKAYRSIEAVIAAGRLHDAPGRKAILDRLRARSR